MRKLFLFTLALVALFANPGCQKPAPPATKFSLDRPFGLKMGQTGESSDVPGFSIRFDKVAADSRCPQGVQCITAGKADVVLMLSKDGSSQAQTLPFTLLNGTSNVTDFKGHTVRVAGVMPLKLKDKEIKPEEYEIALIVTATAPPAAAPAIQDTTARDTTKH